MNNISLLLSALSILATSQAPAHDVSAAEWGPPTNGVQLAITTKYAGNRITTNQPLVLMCQIRNVSSNGTVYTFTVAGTRVDQGFHFTVIAPNGMDISPPLNTNPFYGSAVNVTLGPKEIYKFEFNLGLLCKLNQIGMYKITGTLKLGSVRNKSCEVTSNLLCVYVVPGERKAEGTNAPVGF